MVWSGISICTTIVWSLTASSSSKTMCVLLFIMSLRELVFWGWWSMSLQTPLRCFMHLFSKSLGIALWCGGQLLNIFSFRSIALLVFGGRVRCIRWPSFALIRACHWRHVAGLCMLYKVNSASFHLLLPEFTYPSCSRHSSVRICMWNDLSYTVWR